MAEMLRFGLQLSPLLLWPAVCDAARSAEALGFDSLWVTDHVAASLQDVVSISPVAQEWVRTHVPKPAQHRVGYPPHEAWTLLAGLAVVTSRIRLGTLVTFAGFRNPLVLARQIVTVDHQSAGRLNVGLGAGWGVTDNAAAGMAVREAPERVQRFREVVEIIDQLLRGQVTTYAGRYYRTTAAGLGVAPLQQPRPPLTLAAAGPTMLKLAARYADTWNSGGVNDVGLSIQEACARSAERSAALDEYAVAAGRDPHAIRHSVLAGPTIDSAFASVEAFRDYVERYREIGVTECIFQCPPPFGVTLAPELFERIAREVIPTLREESGSPPA